MTVGELLNRMSSVEFTKWIAYFTIKGEEAKELQRKAKMH